MQLNLLPRTTVVNVSKRSVSYDVYIGRAFGLTHRGSIYSNPFMIGADGNRSEVIFKFIQYWYAPEQRLLRALAVKELRGKVLGCWCVPNQCHGDIIAGYVNWKITEEEGQ